MPKNLSPAAVNAADDFLWLEDVLGSRSLDWVKEQNARTEGVLKSDARYEPFRKEALAILTAQDRIPAPGFGGDGIRNFWQDAKTCAVSGARPRWTATARPARNGPPSSTSTRWQSARKPTGSGRARTASRPTKRSALVNLSDGGKDAVAVREFDVDEESLRRQGLQHPGRQAPD